MNMRANLPTSHTRESGGQNQEITHVLTIKMNGIIVDTDRIFNSKQTGNIFKSTRMKKSFVYF